MTLRPKHTTAKVTFNCENCGKALLADFDNKKDGMNFDGVTDMQVICECEAFYMIRNPLL